jgi:hypothetical protein
VGVRITWRSFMAGGGVTADGRDVLFWFAEESGEGSRDVEELLWTWVHSAYGSYAGWVDSSREDPPATTEEIGEWSRAARRYLDGLATAMADLGTARRRFRRWHWWPARLWAGGRYDRARAAWQRQVDAVTLAYRPVRKVIDRRLDEAAAVRAEVDRRERQAKARRWQETETRFQRWFLAWRCRQEMLDRVLAGGRTARELAAAGDMPGEWPAELEAAVGDVKLWWASVQAAVHNEQARAAAVGAIVDTITATAVALERAGRPGINGQYRAREQVYGWPLEFTWPGLPQPPRLRTPLGIPQEHPFAENWPWDDCLEPHTVAATFTAWTSGGIASCETGYRISTLSSEEFAYGGTRDVWRHSPIDAFTDDRLLPYSISHSWRSGGGYAMNQIRVCDHVDADEYVSYVQAVTRRVVDIFQDLRDKAGL